jgi:hypothetical protein
MDESLVTITTFGNPVEAEMARNHLEESGIHAVLDKTATAGMAWEQSGVVLLVPESEVERARRALASLRRRRRYEEADYGRAGEHIQPRSRRLPPADADEEEDDEITPASDADTMARRAWLSAVIGLLVLPPLLHFYSLWWLLQLPGARDRLSQRGKLMAFGAGVLIGLVALGVFLLVRAITNPAPPRPLPFPE